ncbi:coiled-coil domain-containing protein 66 isoform X2 [Oryzias latipes]|uniref:coiled-coil domain-containing protein 66 isoform X2 n=1 Tax=Oryzias latipes TaxID=8090 RepID=UPI000CE239A0|nr:coiled-coil domain-containing protein 66 isoform X2 [Oryzias latipes]
MNIGDGLLFELENGKPKLILLNRGAEKNQGKLSLRIRPAKVLSSRQPPCAEEVQGDECPARQQTGRLSEVRSKAEGGVSSAHGSVPGSHTEGRKTKRHGQHRRDRAKVVAEVKPNKCCAAVHQEDGGSNEKEALADGDAGVAVLTSDQLHQILSSFKDGDQTGPKSRGSSNERGEERMEKVKETGTPLNSQENVSRASGCAFSWSEERLPHSEAASGAKKAQWRRDLGQQVEQSQHHSAPVRLQDEGGSAGRTEPHTAIRSSLRLGDVSPLDMELNIEKKEEQRRCWLQELDHQRQEATERRRREKLLQNQMEDQERWMAHFDSLQRRAPTRAGAPSAPPEVQLCRAEQRGWEPSSSLSLNWDVSSSCGTDSLVGASVDSSSRCQTRSSYLRTMTSLLDPTQIEERERRRVKQLEQQRAIEAQMEERKKLREEEEAKRREEVEREERRLAQEREMLQRQYELETRKEKEQTEAVLHAESLQTSGGRRKEAGLKDAGVSSLRDTAVQTDSADGVQTLDAAVQYHTPLPRPPAPPNSRGSRAGKENFREPAGGDLYEPFARTERSRGGKRRPEWNTQRPSRRFVPASERYPPDLQRDRQKNRLKRQAELLALQERARPLKPDRPPPHSQDSHLCSTSQLSGTSAPPCRKVETESRGGGGSAVRSHRGQQPPGSPQHKFVPYVRTDEVHLDPLEPADTPPPHTDPGPPAQSPAPPHAPLAHTRRQQQILRGLARLRQGLLQKQKELEMELNPPQSHHTAP